MSAWVIRSCLNLTKEKPELGEGREWVGPRHTPLWVPCGVHQGMKDLTYSSLFTTPWPLGSNMRKALRMASSGSVPERVGGQAAR